MLLQCAWVAIQKLFYKSLIAFWVIIDSVKKLWLLITQWVENKYFLLHGRVYILFFTETNLKTDYFRKTADGFPFCKNNKSPKLGIQSNHIYLFLRNYELYLNIEKYYFILYWVCVLFLWLALIYFRVIMCQLQKMLFSKVVLLKWLCFIIW